MWNEAPDSVREFFEHLADVQGRANAVDEDSKPEKVGSTCSSKLRKERHLILHLITNQISTSTYMMGYRGYSVSAVRQRLV